MLYFGEVMHRRLDRHAYRFRYAVFGLLVDIDALPALDGRLRLFSHNRFNLLSVHDRDFGARDGTSLRAFIDGLLSRHGLDARPTRVRLLCFPRVLGYQFNPIALWLCSELESDRLVAIVAEVHNTCGDQHFYLLHAAGAALPAPVRAGAPKRMYVSPFIAVSGDYRFRFAIHADRFDYTVEQREPGRPRLVARHHGRCAPLTDAGVLRALWRHPLVTLKVIGGIHLEALRLLMRRARIYSRPDPGAEDVTLCTLI